MLSTTVVHRCPPGGGERLQKNGHAEHGAQRAKGVDCQRTFTLSPKGPRYDQKFKDQVVAASQDRRSIRGIPRPFGVCYQTVMVWVGERSGPSPGLRGHALLPGEADDVLALDELWSCVEKKTREAWLWLAVCRRTRQIVACTVGGRRQQSACDWRANLPPASRRRATRRDFWLVYEGALPKRTPRSCGKVMKRARPTRPNASLAPSEPV